MHLVKENLHLDAHNLQFVNQIANCCENPTLPRCICCQCGFFCDMHGCKVDLVNAKIHLVKNYVYLVMTICIFSVTIYVLMELMGAMDGCDG